MAAVIGFFSKKTPVQKPRIFCGPSSQAGFSKATYHKISIFAEVIKHEIAINKK